MHESTVSRVVSNKYIHTPRGLFPMKFFFHSGIDREYGEDISSLTVKRKIKKMIEGDTISTVWEGKRTRAAVIISVTGTGMDVTFIFGSFEYGNLPDLGE